jgi:hypothetical protein
MRSFVIYIVLQILLEGKKMKGTVYEAHMLKIIKHTKIKTEKLKSRQKMGALGADFRMTI